MNVKQYIGHAALYFVKLVILVLLIYALLFVTGSANVSAQYYFSYAFLTSGKGLMLIGAILLVAAVYPTFGVVRRIVAADITADRDKIINAFISNGYSLKSEQEGKCMVFRSGSVVRKLVMMFDDRITVTSEGPGSVVIDGLRKGVVQGQWRIESYMRNNRSDE